MFPEAFVDKHLAATRHAGMVFDPFCGRGTAVFQALLRDRLAAGCDINPVAVCISGAKCDPPDRTTVAARLTQLRNEFSENDDYGSGKVEGDFFRLCFHPDTLSQVLYLRSVLAWRQRKDDRFLSALCLGALHGESHRSPNYFSNRMSRTISTKPEYSVRWWRRNGWEAPRRNVFDILERALEFRFRSRPPMRTGRVVESDARRIAEAAPDLKGTVTDVITSPPYLDTTNFREDQWLRLWFLGGEPAVPRGRGDDRHYSPSLYWTFLEDSWRGLAPLLAEQARVVVRIGGRKLDKEALRDGLVTTLQAGLDRHASALDEGVSLRTAKTQANAFRGSGPSRLEEHDFVFAV
ncbi:MAG: DNA methylase [Alphaproteobacteria bacterium]|nr:DNA methylase [Alphaproteobacteria bacterium]